MTTTPMPLIVAVSGEDDRFAAVRARAAALGAGGRASVLLYDIDAASPLESPLPTNWSADGAEGDIPDRLGPDDLEAAGRPAVAGHVRALREMGVDAWAWLPDSGSEEDLGVFARDRGADLVLVPPGMTAPNVRSAEIGPGDPAADPTRPAGTP